MLYICNNYLTPRSSNKEMYSNITNITYFEHKKLQRGTNQNYKNHIIKKIKIYSYLLTKTGTVKIKEGVYFCMISYQFKAHKLNHLTTVIVLH